MLVCLRCFSDKTFRKLLRESSDLDECSFCNRRRLAVEVQVVAELLRDGLSNAYEHGQPNDYGSSFGHEGDSLELIIAEEVGTDHEVAYQIAEILYDGEHRSWAVEGDCFFDREASFVKSSRRENFLHFHWDSFADEIKTKSRFFGSIRSFLEKLFCSGRNSLFEGGYPELLIRPNGRTSLFRARVAYDYREVVRFAEAPHRELSYNPVSPPAGRMNADGISAFYCALSMKTAIKEVRPSIGAFVVVGEFKALQTIKLLDLTKMGEMEPGRIYSPGFKERSEKIAFLESFDWKVSQPIQPNKENIDYLPTQMVAEYIHHVLGFDGVVFSSAQENDRSDNSKRNIALFGCVDWRVGLEGKPVEEDPFLAEDQWLEISIDDVKVVEVSGISYDATEVMLAISDPDFFPGADPD